jgi:hypothetical protein
LFHQWLLLYLQWYLHLVEICRVFGHNAMLVYLKSYSSCQFCQHTQCIHTYIHNIDTCITHA